MRLYASLMEGLTMPKLQHTRYYTPMSAHRAFIEIMAIMGVAIALVWIAGAMM